MFGEFHAIGKQIDEYLTESGHIADEAEGQIAHDTVGDFDAFFPSFGCD